MRTMELRTTDGRRVARDVRVACSFTSRWSGRFRRVPAGEHDRVLLIPCRSVHTIGMRFAIDVVFLSRRLKIIGLAQALPPWRFKLAPRGTRWVLQLAAGQIAAAGLKLDTFVIVESAPAPAQEQEVTPSTAECALRATRPLPRPVCERSPLQFSLRVPPERRCKASVASRDDAP